MDRDLLFLRTMEDLERRVMRPKRDEYELLAIAALLRRLLLDAEPLVDLVNRTRRLKIRFRTMYPATMTEVDLPEPPLPGANTPFPIGTKTVTKGEFLSRFAAFIAPYEYKVKDLILYGANIAGGVHAGLPRNDREATMMAGSETVRIFGLDPSIYELVGIGQVIVKGLAPLYQQVKNETVQK